MQQFGLDFKFHAPRSCRLHGTTMGCGRNCRGPAHDPDFVVIFDQSHFIENDAYVAYIAGSGNAAACLAADLVHPAYHPRVPRSIHASGVINRIFVCQ